MGQQGTRTVVLDAGALIAFERAQSHVVLLIETIRAGDERVVVPARTYARSVVLTGDAADLRRLDPSLDVHASDNETVRSSHPVRTRDN